MATADDTGYPYEPSDGRRQLVVAFDVAATAPFLFAFRQLLEALRLPGGAPAGVSVRGFRLWRAPPVTAPSRQNARLAGGPLPDIRDEVFHAFLFVVGDGTDDLEAVASGSPMAAFDAAVDGAVRSRYSGIYRNTYRFNRVSTDPSKTYLFNLFATDGDSPEEWWKRSSGWFFRHASFRSSYNMVAVDDRVRYRLVNFAHLDSVPRLVLAALFRRGSLQREVSDVFRDNRLVTRPLLVREVV